MLETTIEILDLVLSTLVPIRSPPTIGIPPPPLIDNGTFIPQAIITLLVIAIAVKKAWIQLRSCSPACLRK